MGSHNGDSPDPLAVLEAARPELVHDAGGGGAAEVLDHELEPVNNGGKALPANTSTGTTGEVLEVQEERQVGPRLEDRDEVVRRVEDQAELVAQLGRTSVLLLTQNLHQPHPEVFQQLTLQAYELQLQFRVFQQSVPDLKIA